MKKLIIALIIVCNSITIYANKIDSNIKHVTVYQRGAKISRTASVNVKPGNNKIILTNLTSSIQANSIQVNINGNATLLSANFHVNYLDDEPKTKRRKDLSDSLKLITRKITYLKYQLQLLEEQATLLGVNMKLGSEQQSITVAELAKMVEYQKSESKKIMDQQFKTENELSDLNEMKQRISQQLGLMPGEIKKNVGEIYLNVLSNTPQKITIDFSYYTNQAGWTPIYDIRSLNNSNSVNINYKAKVIQYTGYDWENVQLSVSTGNPALNHNRPVLNPWYLYLGYQEIYEEELMLYDAETEAPAIRNLALAKPQMKKEIAETPEYIVTEVNSQISKEYKINLKQTVNTDSEEVIVELIQKEIDAKFNYHAVPKLQQRAYLIASIGNYGSLNLVPGNANIFFDNNYIGKTYLQSNITSDTLLVSFGIDNNINVSYNQLSDYSNSKTIGNTQRLTKAYEIVIKNNKQQTITIDILDQLPISNNKEIEVIAEDISGAEKYAEIGKLNWLKTIEAGQMEKIKIVYTVKYPKGSYVRGL